MQSTLDYPATSAPNFLQSLIERGLTVSTKGDSEGKRLIVAPKSLLTDDDRVQLTQLKPQLLELVESARVSWVLPASRWSEAAPKLPPIKQSELDRVRVLLAALDAHLKDDAPVAIVRAMQRLKRLYSANSHTDYFWRCLSPEDKHALALSVALLDCGLDPGVIAP